MFRFTTRLVFALLLLTVNAQAQSWTQRPGTDSWYRQTTSNYTWSSAAAEAVQQGGHLAVFETQEECNWAKNYLIKNSDVLTWIGLVQDPTSTNQSEGWSWINGQPLSYDDWASGQPEDSSSTIEDHGDFRSDGLYDENESYETLALFEIISIDCDEDGAPDTYQIASNPSLDANTDGIIDSCVNLTWVRRGLSGQWFAINLTSIAWDSHAELASSLGAKLAVIEDAEENEWVFSNFTIQGTSTYIGLYQDPNDPDYWDGDGGWKWIDGTPLTYTNWGPGEPNDNSSGVDYGSIGNAGQWDDRNGQGPALYELTSGDCNHNGTPDSYEILQNPSLDLDSDGALDSCVFGPKTIIDSNSLGARFVSSGDLDGDGDLDVVAASEEDDTIAWFENLGDGVFGQRQLLVSGDPAFQEPYCVTVVDIDGDGINDILASAYRTHHVFWLRNLGGGVFAVNPLSVASEWGELAGVKGIHAADLDNDGDADVMTSAETLGDIMWYRNDAEAGFAAGVQLAALDGANSVFSADLDGDSDEDVVAGSYWDGLYWFENLDGQGAFSPGRLIYTNSGFEWVYISDMDGDGDNDVVTASRGDNQVSWFENLDGQGTSFQRHFIASISWAGGVHAADIDSDLDIDVISSNYGDGVVSWHENLGSGSFASPQVIAVNARSGFASDLNGDGAPDVLTASLSDDEIAWYKNLIPDCNQNGQADRLDISSGISLDCDSNGIPDECEYVDCDLDNISDNCAIADGSKPDCNSNGVPDWCDINSGTSYDCNVNLVPDECDQDCDGNGSPDDCDPFIPDCDSDGLPDGCEIDCNLNSTPDDCELVGNDCNASGVPDDCELINNDCDANGIPDECDTDCNADGTPDSCQRLADCNSDEIPDECQPLEDCNSDEVPDECQSLDDCDNNGTPDECERFDDCNEDSIPDVCQLENNDCNASSVPDECELPDNDCNDNDIPDECDVANLDCNENGVPDDCDALQLDCNNNGIPDECDVANLDCNENGVPDDCDVLQLDCNNNGIPDECDVADLDCNENGTPDDCDALQLDCNSNGIPDECDATTLDCNVDSVPDDCQLYGNDCDTNGIPDECDPDCDGDGEPDTCDPDCNENGVSDICDTLPGGGSDDVNGNSLPDECECLSNWFCSTSPNSVGTGAMIDYEGTLSVELNNLTLTVSGGPVGQPGLFYYGSTQINGGNGAPFGQGLRCVGGSGQPTFRVEGPAFFGGAGNAIKEIDLTYGPMGSGPGQIIPGSVLNFQFWYRDPTDGPPGQGFNFSDAVQLTFCR